MSKTIFIVDDDPAILESLKMLLELEGYRTEVAQSSKKLYALSGNYPDLILLDIWLSGEDGRDVSKYLKSHAPTKHIPIILFSASRDLEKSARAALADDFLAKPFDVEELTGKIAKLLAK